MTEISIPNVPSELIEQMNLETLWRTYLLRITAFKEIKDDKTHEIIMYGKIIKIPIVLMIADIYDLNLKTGNIENKSNKKEIYNTESYMEEYWGRITLLQKELYRMQREEKLTNSIDIDKWSNLNEGK